MYTLCRILEKKEAVTIKRVHDHTILSRRVHLIPLQKIYPNPCQPRRFFEERALQELAGSIAAFGILQPLTVRAAREGYELVAGERRWRAAKLAGLKEAPCLIAQVDEQDAEMLALIENLQRMDLDCFEEAAAIARLISRYDLSQEQAAQKLGKSQSAIANKLRLLRLEESVQHELLAQHLTERHARVLLRLEGEQARLDALHHITKEGLNVAKTEEYIESLLQQRQLMPSPHRATCILKDVRLFLNSIDRSIRFLQRSGIDAAVGRQDSEGEILLTIRIANSRANT